VKFGTDDETRVIMCLRPYTSGGDIYKLKNRCDISAEICSSITGRCYAICVHVNTVHLTAQHLPFVVYQQ